MYKIKATVGVERLTSFSKTAESCLLVLEGNMSKAKIEWKERNPWASHYCRALGRCKYKNHKGYKYYGGKGIKLKMTIEDFKKLWIRDKAHLMKQPSIHRKNNKKDYTIRNCEFIELQKHHDMCKRAVIQKSFHGKTVNVFPSIIEVERKLGFCSQSIGRVASGIRKQAYGFKWEYAKTDIAKLFDTEEG